MLVFPERRDSPTDVSSEMEEFPEREVAMVGEEWIVMNTEDVCKHCECFSDLRDSIHTADRYPRF